MTDHLRVPWTLTSSSMRASSSAVHLRTVRRLRVVTVPVEVTEPVGVVPAALSVEKGLWERASAKSATRGCVGVAGNGGADTGGGEGDADDGGDDLPCVAASMVPAAVSAALARCAGDSDDSTASNKTLLGPALRRGDGAPRLCIR